MRFVHLNPKNQPVSNEWYFFSSGKELLVTISNPSWSGDADYRGSYTYQRTGDNTGTITTADMPRQGNGYHSKMKYVVHLEFSGSSAATGTFRERYEESDRPQMNEDYSWQNQPVTFD